MLTTHFLLHEGPSFQSHEDISQMLNMAFREEEVIEYDFMLEEEPLIDAYFNDGAKGETHELESLSFKDNEEDLNPESPQTLQEWMMEYEKFCRKLMATYNSQDIFSLYCKRLERLHNTKSEYKESPTNDLLLEAFYQNHVVNILEIIL